MNAYVIKFTTPLNKNGNRSSLKLHANGDNAVWTEKNTGCFGSDVKLSRKMLRRLEDHIRTGLLKFCTELDINGNMFLMDINLEERTYKKGYCYRLGCRADDIVAPKRELDNLEKALEWIGFKRIN